MGEAGGTRRKRRFGVQRESIVALRSSDLATSVWLAGAMIANNVLALAATIVFARLLDDYGSFAALVSYFLLLSVAGNAMQVATARESAIGALGTDSQLAATLRAWTLVLLTLTLATAVLSVLLRVPIARMVGIDQTWAAAVGLPAGILWLLLSILRGALQGVSDYRGLGVSLIGEQGGRLLFGATLTAAGLGVTGAFLGTPLALIAMATYCGLRLRPRLAATAGAAADVALRLRHHVVRAWAPIAGLIVVAMLQNVDVIAAKHRFSSDVASSYSATAVAAKVLVWIAVGAGFYLVPEASRRHAATEDTRPVLLRSIAIVLACAIPALSIFAFGGELLLRLTFGSNRLLTVDALLPLGVAFTLLAITLLAIQYQLALQRTRFLLGLGVVALAEPLLLVTAAPGTPAGFAAVVLALQALAAGLSLALALRSGHAPADGQNSPS